MEFVAGVTRFHIYPNEKSICCSSCGSGNVIRRGTKEWDEKAHLDAAVSLNEPLAKGYHLKEELRLFFGETFRWPAQLFLRSWCKRAIATRLSPLKTMTKTLTRLEDGLLSYFDHRISSGPMEGTNNKINTVQR